MAIPDPSADKSPVIERLAVAAILAGPMILIGGELIGLDSWPQWIIGLLLVAGGLYAKGRSSRSERP